MPACTLPRAWSWRTVDARRSSVSQVHDVNELAVNGRGQGVAGAVVLAFQAVGDFENVHMALRLQPLARLRVADQGLLAAFAAALACFQGERASFSARRRGASAAMILFSSLRTAPWAAAT